MKPIVVKEVEFEKDQHQQSRKWKEIPDIVEHTEYPPRYFLLIDWLNNKR